MTDATFSFPAEQQTKLSVFGVIGTTLRTFAKAPLVFLAIALIAEAPSLVILLGPHTPSPQKFNAAAIVVTVVKMLILFLFQTTMTYIAVRILEGEKPEVGAAVRLGLRRYLSVLGTTLLVLLASYLGLILLVVPGLILAFMYAVAIPVCAIENKGPVASLKRSAALTKTLRWRVAGIYACFFGALLLVSLPVTFLLILRGHVLLGQWINFGLQLLWVPIATIFSAVIYVELRRLKENVRIANIFD